MPTAKTGTRSVDVWVATLDQADLTLCAWLDERERERFHRYQADADRARFLLGATLVRSAVGRALGVGPGEVGVDRTCPTCGGWHGRPSVPESPVTLSVSHGGLLVALALSLGGPVGVDVERVGSRDEQATRSWTHAEARFKAGSGADLAVRDLPAPVRGHLLALAAPADAEVRLRAAAELLP